MEIAFSSYQDTVTFCIFLLLIKEKVGINCGETYCFSFRMLYLYYSCTCIRVLHKIFFSSFYKDLPKMCLFYCLNNMVKARHPHNSYGVYATAQ